MWKSNLRIKLKCVLKFFIDQAVKIQSWISIKIRYVFNIQIAKILNLLFQRNDTFKDILCPCSTYSASWRFLNIKCQNLKNKFLKKKFQNLSQDKNSSSILVVRHSFYYFPTSNRLLWQKNISAKPWFIFYILQF